LVDKWKSLDKSSQKPLDQRKVISLLESATVWIALQCVKSRAQNKVIHAFVDNSVTLFSLMAGYSKKFEVRIIAQGIIVFCKNIGCVVYIHYIPSIANISDGPTKLSDLEDQFIQTLHFLSQVFKVTEDRLEVKPLIDEVSRIVCGKHK
jgi:hypothetical protein